MKRFKRLLLGAALLATLGPVLPAALASTASPALKPTISAPSQPAAPAPVVAPQVESAKVAEPAVAAQAAPAAESEVSLKEFLGKVLDVIEKFGGLPTVLKIAAIIALLISSMKVSLLNQLIWSHLGAAKVWVAPFLGLIAGLLDLAGAGTVTLASVVAYVGSGAGAILLHELLDSVKKIPKAGSIWVSMIEFVQKRLGAKPKAQP